MNEPLKINPKFAQIIPPLTADEFAQLEENILKLGRVIEPIQVWKGFIVDGHHRYKVVQKHPEITYTTCELDYTSDYEVISWMCKCQLGRRNITESQRDYLLGQRYEAEKCIWGGDRKSEDAKSSYQNDNLISTPKTCARLAKEENISQITVLRAADYKKGVDAADEECPGIKRKILSGEVNLPKGEICKIARLPKEERKEAVELLLIPKDKRKSKEIARQIEEAFANGTEQDPEEETPHEKEVVAHIPESAPKTKPTETEEKGDNKTEKREIEESILNSMIGAVNMFIDSINNYLSRFPRLRTDPKYRSQTREIMVAARDYINDVEGDLL